MTAPAPPTPLPADWPIDPSSPTSPVSGAGIYVASKTTHAARWQALRAAGYPIISTWIDEAGAGSTSDWRDLWDRCIAEPSRAAATIVYVEPGEALKGAYVEMGAALANGRPVYVVGDMPASARQHRLVTLCTDLGEALVYATDACRGAWNRRVPAPPDAAMAEALAWAVGRWDAEVKHRPPQNIHRRSLDDAWRQVIRYWGGDEHALLSLPPHDELVAALSAAARAGRGWGCAVSDIDAIKARLAAARLGFVPTAHADLLKHAPADLAHLVADVERLTALYDANDIAAWNRRAVPPGQATMAEALREDALEAIRDRLVLFGHGMEQTDARPTKRHLRLWAAQLHAITTDLDRTLGLGAALSAAQPAPPALAKEPS